MPADPTTGQAGGAGSRSTLGNWNRISFALGQNMPTKLAFAREARRAAMRNLPRDVRSRFGIR